MTNTEYLLRLTSRAKASEEPNYGKYCVVFDEGELSRLVAIVVADEREACAMACEAWSGTNLKELAEHLRQRSNAD